LRMRKSISFLRTVPSETIRASSIKWDPLQAPSEENPTSRQLN
jgi:hypothetical protein